MFNTFESFFYTISICLILLSTLNITKWRKIHAFTKWNIFFCLTTIINISCLPLSVSQNAVTPTVSADVLRTASLRHQKGLMAPIILHVLSTHEVRLPCLMEDEGNREFPPIHDIYQPLRQKVYAVLFNLHHLRYVHSKKKGKRQIHLK